MPQSERGERFLRDYHAKLPGASPRVLAGARDPEGRSSYDILAAVVPSTSEPLTVVDLACGDGYLLQILAARRQPNLRLIGLDMSPEEIEAARRRLGPTPTLHVARAQDMPLPDRSADIVVSHMAMMLMSPIEDVAAEVRRILRPGGLLFAVVSSRSASEGAWIAFVEAAREIMAGEGREVVPIGDARMGRAEGLRSIFNAEAGFEEPVGVRDIPLTQDGPPEDLVEYMMTSYWAEMVSDEGRGLLEARAKEIVEGVTRPDGRAVFRRGIRLLRCRTRSCGS